MPARKKAAHERKNYFTSLWCTEAQMKAWMACAELENVNLSTWIRSSLDFWVQQGYKLEVGIDLRLTGRYVKR